MKKWLPRLLPLAFIVAPPMAAAWYLGRFAVNVPFWDQWEFVPLLQALHNHNTRWLLHILWTPHNEHRLLFPRLAFLLLSRISDWNVIVEMYFSLFLACLSLIGLALIYKRACRGSLWGFVPLSWLVFSLGQWENLIWGWQIQIFLQVWGTIWGVYFLSAKSLKSTALAILCGVVASFSFNSGLLIWPTGLLLLAALRTEKKQTALWSLAGVVVIAAYFHGYTLPPYHPSLAAVFSSPFTTFKFFLANVGSPLGGGDGNLSLTMGGCLGAFFLAVSYKKLQMMIRTSRPIPDSDIVLTGLVLTSLLSSMAITAGRVGFGNFAWAINSRYITIVSIGIIGIYMLILGDKPNTSQHVNGLTVEGFPLLPALLPVLFIGLVMANLYGTGLWRKWIT